MVVVEVIASVDILKPFKFDAFMYNWHGDGIHGSAGPTVHTD